MACCRRLLRTALLMMLTIVIQVTVTDAWRQFDPNTETISDYKVYLTKQIQDERDARTGAASSQAAGSGSGSPDSGATTTVGTTAGQSNTGAPTTSAQTEAATTTAAETTTLAPTTTPSTTQATTSTDAPTASTKSTKSTTIRTTPTHKTPSTKAPPTTTRSASDADTVFLSCCKNNPKVLAGCYKYCNYESWSMPKLQAMYLAKDCGPGSIQSFIVCGSHELDNTECCEQANVNAPNLPKECMNMCHSDIASVKMSMKYLPCMNKLSSFRECYLNNVQANIDNGNIKVE